MIIAVDFDGTIVENKYPRIGKEIPFAIDTLKELQSDQHILILWTVRDGKLLEEAVNFCRKRGLEFYAVNRNYPEESDNAILCCRKINADFFIDDRNVGGLPDWGTIYQIITEGVVDKDNNRPLYIEQNTRKQWICRILKRIIK